MNCRKGCSPPRRGGVAAPSIKMLRSLLMKAQTGWSVPDNVRTSTFTIMDHPVCAASEASRLFLTGAATPPVPGGEHPVIHTFYERGYVPTLLNRTSPLAGSMDSINT